MTDQRLVKQLDLYERAYLVLTIWAEDYSNVDPDHQKVITDLQQEIKRITKELERKPDLSIEANRVAYDVAMHYANKTKEKLG